MSKLTLTRRSFVKLSAITAAASGLSFAAKPSDALAEGRAEFVNHLLGGFAVFLRDSLIVYVAHLESKR